MRSILFATAALGLAAAAQARAEEAGRTIDELVVTAEKHEQALSSTPLSVTVLDGQLLQDAEIHDIKDLPILTPGLLVASTSNATYTTARIRGVGTVGDNPGLESSVGVVVDGVYRARNGVALTDLGELERIEVLKGPQGTLFGKSTSAGVINVLTKAPSFEFSAEGELTAGDHGTLGGSAAVTGPIVADKLAGRLYVARRVRDGFYEVKTGEGPRTETQDDDQDLATVRGQLLFTPSPSFSLRVIGDYTERDENCCVGVQIRTGPSGALVDQVASDEGVAQVAHPWDRVAYSNRNTHERIRDGGLSAQADWRGESVDVTSITAWRDWDADLGQDWDFTSADIAYRPDDGSFGNEFRTFSQELRVSGKTGRLDWLVGGFYGDEDLDRTDRFLYGADYETYLGLVLSGGTNPALVSDLTGLPAGQSFVEGEGLRDRYRQDAQTYALFTHDTLHLTDTLDLTGGLRWTHDRKSVEGSYDNSDNGRACAAARALGVGSPAAIATICLPWSNPAFNNLQIDQELSQSNWSGTARLAWRPTQGLLAYASYSRGYKAPGFNLDRAQTALVPDPDTSFPAETVDSYEVGLRSRLADGRLLLNAAVFDEEFRHFQLNTFIGTTFVVRSIPEASSKGVDVDFVWLPAAGLSLQGGVTYADTRYGDQAVAGLPLLPGQRLSFAPLWSGSLSATYERPIGSNLIGRLNIDGKWTSAYNTGSDLLPRKEQEAYGLLNAKVAIGAADGRWAVELWARNLTDTGYYQVAFNAPFQGSTGLRDAPAPVYDPARDTQTYGAFLGAPRTVGVTLRARY